MVLLLDLLLVVIFTLCVVSGYKNGLIKTVVRLFGGLIAFILARIVASSFSEALAKILPMPSLGEKISSNVTTAVLGSDTALTVGELLKKVGIPDHIIADLKETLSSSVASTAEEAASRISDAFSSMVAYALLFVISFILFSLLLKLLCVWLNIFSKLPLIRTANKLLGGILGVISGLFFAWLAAVMISWLGPVLAGLCNLDISTLQISRTYIFQYLAGYNPLGIFLSKK